MITPSEQSTASNTTNNTVSPVKPSKPVGILAEIISIVFHPLFMPLLMAVVIYYLAPDRFVGINRDMQIQLLGIIILNTVFFPLLATLLMKALKFIPTIRMHEKKDRIMPLMAIMIFYFWMYQVVKNIPTQSTLTSENMFLFCIFFLGNFFAIIGVFMANIFTKISMHTAAAGGAVGILVVLAIVGKVNITIPILVTVAIAGIVGTARMLAYAHKPFQIWLGYFVGLAAQLLAYWMWI